MVLPFFKLYMTSFLVLFILVVNLVVKLPNMEKEQVKRHRMYVFSLTIITGFFTVFMFLELLFRKF